MIDRRALMAGTLSGLAVASMTSPALADATMDWPAPAASLPLWPHDAPGALGKVPTERLTERSKSAAYKDRAYDQIGHPRLDIFPAATPNGAGVLIIPGGGYQRVVIDREGYEMAAWFNARGITAFVLFYRLPAEGWADAANVPLADAQRAMRLIRLHASALHVDPERLMAMGFSAGGHLCADLATRFDTKVYAPVDSADVLAARPTLAAPIYPVVSMAAPVAHQGSRTNLLGLNPTPEQEAAHSPDRNVRTDSPPCFLVHAEDDPVVPVANTLLLHTALKGAKVPVELHLFERGGHGFAMRNAVGLPAFIWPELFLSWAGTHIKL